LDNVEKNMVLLLDRSQMTV
jgi:hypothetical protein